MKKIDYDKWANTELKNARFKKANKARKRVMIAKDVLAQLGSRMFAKSKVWVEDPNLLRQGITAEIMASDGEAEVCDVTYKLKTCNVCGIGALFVSAVEFADKLKVNKLDNYDPNYSFCLSPSDLWGYLGQFFDDNQLNLIECAFELNDGHVTTIDKNRGSLFFCDDFEVIYKEFKIDPNLRMRLIMENIVTNKGTFVPTQKPIKETVYVTPGYKG